MEIKSLGVKVATRSFSICDDLDLACPVPAGDHVVAKFRFPVPWYAVKMSTNVVIQAVDAAGERLICLEAHEVPVVGRKGAGAQQEEEEDGGGGENGRRSRRRPKEEDEQMGAVGGDASPALRRRREAVVVNAQEVFLAM